MLSFYLQMVETPEEKSLVEFLYTEYRQLMFRIAMSVLHNEYEAEDAVHEAFVRIIKNISKFHQYSCQENRAYAVIVVKGIALNMKNKQKDSEEYLDDIPDRHCTEEEIEVKITCEEIMANISALSPTLKNTAYLYFAEQLTPAEIAEMLDIKTDTVYQRIHRARAILLGGEKGKGNV